MGEGEDKGIARKDRSVGKKKTDSSSFISKRKE